MAVHAQRRDDARPEQDRLPGRDRRRLRADRLLAVQRPLRRGGARRAADGEQQGRLEPHRPPPARGLRLRDHALQLHGDRRQPADGPRADGEHRRLEALARPGVRRALHHAAARGGRPPARGDQPGARRRPRRQRGRAGLARPRRDPLHRLDADLQAPVALGGGEPRHLPRVPAHRRRDRRQGLRARRTPRPTSTSCERRSCGAPSSTRGRSARRPRARTCRGRSGH